MKQGWGDDEKISLLCRRYFSLLRTFKSFVRLTLISTLVLILIASLEARPEKIRVVVKSLSDKNIRIHCKSSEDDIGVHDLKHQQDFSWRFKPNVSGPTKFDCDIQTAYGSGYYNVFDQEMDTVCRPECVWNVNNSGPCLMSEKELFQEWQKRPNGPPKRRLKNMDLSWSCPEQNSKIRTTIEIITLVLLILATLGIFLILFAGVLRLYIYCLVK